jgi:hypothetical protein
MRKYTLKIMKRKPGNTIPHFPNSPWLCWQAESSNSSVAAGREQQHPRVSSCFLFYHIHATKNYASKDLF